MKKNSLIITFVLCILFGFVIMAYRKGDIAKKTLGDNKLSPDVYVKEVVNLAKKNMTINIDDVGLKQVSQKESIEIGTKLYKKAINENLTGESKIQLLKLAKNYLLVARQMEKK